MHLGMSGCIGTRAGYSVQGIHLGHMCTRRLRCTGDAQAYAQVTVCRGCTGVRAGCGVQGMHRCTLHRCAGDTSGAIIIGYNNSNSNDNNKSSNSSNDSSNYPVCRRPRAKRAREGLRTRTRGCGAGRLSAR